MSAGVVRHTRPGSCSPGRSGPRSGSPSAWSSWCAPTPRTPWSATSGPDLLGPDWDPAEARAPARAPTHARALADALLDQRNLAGIGNVYKSELCFLSGLHPRTPVGAVDDLDRIVDRAHRCSSPTATGSSRPPPATSAAAGSTWVYRRDRQPCRRCGTRILVDQQGPEGQERATYWCPTCQPSQLTPWTCRSSAAPAALWRRWVLLAAGRAALGDRTCEIRRQRLVRPPRRRRRVAADASLRRQPRCSVGAPSRPEARRVVPRRAARHRPRLVVRRGQRACGPRRRVPRLVRPRQLVVGPADRFPSRSGPCSHRSPATPCLADWWRTTWADATDDHLAAVLKRPDRPTLAAVVGATAATRAGKQVGTRAGAGPRARSRRPRPLTCASRSICRCAARASSATAATRPGRRCSGSGRREPHRRPVPARRLRGRRRAGRCLRPVRERQRPSADAEQRSLDNVLMELRMTETDETVRRLAVRPGHQRRPLRRGRARLRHLAGLVRRPGRRPDHVRPARGDGPARPELASRLGAPAAVGTLLRRG